MRNFVRSLLFLLNHRLNPFERVRQDERRECRRLIREIVGESADLMKARKIFMREIVDLEGMAIYSDGGLHLTFRPEVWVVRKDNRLDKERKIAIEVIEHRLE